MRSVKKQDLPEKTCLVCQKPFTWRKKWEKNWEMVKYCSVRCKKTKTNSLAPAPSSRGHDKALNSNKLVHSNYNYII